MDMKIGLFFIVLATFFGLGELRTFACECVDMTGGAYERFQQADAVFIGQVRDTRILENLSGISSYWQVEVRFEIKRALKGVSGKEVFLRTGTGPSDCGLSFEKGKKYLVYADGPVGSLETDSCAKTKEIRYAARDLKDIRDRRRQTILLESSREKPGRIISPLPLRRSRTPQMNRTRSERAFY
jgi:hypothetical protein